MKKNISRNPLWPDWYNGKKIDEVQFGRAFLEQWPLKCVNGTLYTLDGPVEDESEIKQRILENIEEYVTSGLSKKVTNILETIKLLAFSDPFPIEQDCIHLQNGVYHLPDGSFQESRLFCQNRLPVNYDPKAATPDRWLTFLHELLDDADIPTLQEYLGYCLIPSTKGQKMMLIVGKGGEGKSRIGLVLKRLMGDAASNGSVQKVENNRFARADLERRLLMIDDDMDMNALPKTNYIKTIVTAEAKLDLERKGVQVVGKVGIGVFQRFPDIGSLVVCQTEQGGKNFRLGEAGGFLIQFEGFDHAFNHGFAVVGVHDCESRRISQVFRMLAQDAVGNGMERAAPQAGQVQGNQGPHPFRHFPRRRIGEGKQQNVPWVRTVIQKPGHAISQRARFSRSGSCDDKSRPRF